LEEVSALDAAELKKVIKEERWDSAILSCAKVRVPNFKEV